MIEIINVENELLFHQNTIQRIRELGSGISASIIAGSGVISSIPSSSIIAEIDYDELTTLPKPTVAGHKGKVYLCSISGKKVVVFGARFHLYEGYLLREILSLVLITKELGIATCILTNAAGGLSPTLSTGDIVLVDDFVNCMYRAFSFDKITPSTTIETNRLIELTKSLLVDKGIPYSQGTYIAVTGPSYETKAEIHFYRKLGEAIGMSTYHEYIACKQLGITPIVFSTITNILSDTTTQSVTHDEVLEVTHRIKGRLWQCIECVVSLTQHLSK
jgi:purine-nucleoside phosphorylase